jgi:hypothetical protein
MFIANVEIAKLFYNSKGLCGFHGARKPVHMYNDVQKINGISPTRNGEL